MISILQYDLFDPKLTSRGKLPSHVDMTDEKTEKTDLCGLWKFRYCLINETEEEWLSPSYDDSSWEEFPVPGHWELLGHGTPLYVNTRYVFAPTKGELFPPHVPDEKNHVGVYRKTVSYAGKQPGKRTVLCLSGVQSAVHVFVNGTPVGFSSCGKTPSEFDLTSYLQIGDNCLCLCVTEFCAGAFLECQDMWRMSGILHEVFLYDVPEVGILDCFAFSEFSEDFSRVRLSMEVKLFNHTDTMADPVRVRGELYDADGILIADGEGITGNHSGRWDEINQRNGSFAEYPAPVLAGCVGTVYLFLHPQNPVLWYPDRPYLYRIVLRSFAADGTCTSECSFAYGFRKTEIDEEGVLRLNGKPFKFFGVNRHEISPRGGRVVTREEMLWDILLMKQNNVNAVRCSHYPDKEEWYRLCDEYGLLVMDEADVETHGISYRASVLPGNDQRWLYPMLDRVDAMFACHKNHPCVVMWSLGNELGFGETVAACASYLHAMDPTRPVHKRQMNSVADVDSETYPTPGNIEARAKNPSKKPFFPNEYAHAMGNAMGSFADYDDVIRRYPKVSGGFVWEWCDHGLYAESADGTPYFTYGGDRGEELHDGNFCMDGIVSADRRETAKLAEVKAVYTPVTVVYAPDTKTVTLHNWFTFLSLDVLSMRLTVKKNGLTVSEEVLSCPPVLPGEEGSIVLPLTDPEGAGEWGAVLTLVWKEKTAFADAGHPVFSVWLPIRRVPEKLCFPAFTGEVAQGENTLSVTVGRETVVFDTETGRLSALTVDGKPLLSDADLRLCLYRSPTDNDIHSAGMVGSPNWKSAGLDALTDECRSFTWEKTDGNVKIVCDRRISGDGKNGFMQKVTYTVHGDGKITVETSLEKFGELPYLPRVGMVCELPRETDAYTWYGLGPWETYSDRKKNGICGLYTVSAKEAAVCPYEKPQEYGNHEDTTFVRIRVGETHLGIFTREPLAVGFMPYDPAETDACRHAYELAKTEGAARRRIHIDYAQSGLGNRSCGPEALEQYLLKREYYEFSFVLAPLSGTDKDFSFCCTDYETPALLYGGHLPARELSEEAEVYYDPSDPDMRAKAGFPT